MTSIKKVFKTETAHIVRNAISERCRFNVHGHSYKWEVIIEGPMDPISGMVLDFKELKVIKEFIDQFDHAMVLWSEDDPNFIKFFMDNTHRVIVMKKNVTAENMARVLHRLVNEWLTFCYCILFKPGTKGQYTCKQVNVWETETGCAETTESDENDIITYMHKDNG